MKRKQILSFDQLGLSDQMMATLKKIGYEKPSPIQAGVIPLAMDEHDVIGQARTGTGKTAAFAIPILEQLDLDVLKPKPQALILTPTRELAVQVENEFRRMSDESEVRCCCLYGGRPIKKQINQLEKGCHVVVGTPGRVIDHLNRRTLNIDQLWFVVLDEADRMLDIGFRPDIEKILRRCPEERQTMLLSATLPESIIKLAKTYMYRPKVVNFSQGSVAADTIEQFYITVPGEMKYETLVKLLKREEPEQSIIFCRTKLGTEKLYRKLFKSGKFEGVATLHGDMTQSSRDRVMKDFRAATVRYLVATDVVGRGIDITNVSHIINFDIPELSDDYVHRVGRTGRMGKQGVAFSLVRPDQGNELTAIEQKINVQLKKDPLQEEIDKIRAANEPKRPERAKPKSRYRRGL
ncbi:DEAD/DEAH box helicase [Mariniblastus sp.]|nr:DEAD/DEAH box helicase [Mariniblastus sp.]